MIKDYNPKEIEIYNLVSEEFSMLTPNLRTIYNAIIFYNIKVFEIYNDKDKLIFDETYKIKDIKKLIDNEIITEEEELTLLMILNHITYNQ